jgi:hypothetical protein
VRLTSDILRGFFQTQQDVGDSELAVPPILSPTLEIPSPLGPLLVSSPASPYPQNQVESQSLMMAWYATRTNIAGASFRVLGLEKGLWDLTISMRFLPFTAIATPLEAGIQFSFDQLTFIGGPFVGGGPAAGVATQQTFRLRFALQSQLFLNASLPSAGVGETIVHEMNVFANRLQ